LGFCFCFHCHWRFCWGWESGFQNRILNQIVMIWRRYGYQKASGNRCGCDWEKENESRCGCVVAYENENESEILKEI